MNRIAIINASKHEMLSQFCDLFEHKAFICCIDEEHLPKKTITRIENIQHDTVMYQMDTINYQLLCPRFVDKIVFVGDFDDGPMFDLKLKRIIEFYKFNNEVFDEIKFDEQDIVRSLR